MTPEQLQTIKERYRRTANFPGDVFVLLAEIERLQFLADQQTFEIRQLKSDGAALDLHRKVRIKGLEAKLEKAKEVLKQIAFVTDCAEVDEYEACNKAYEASVLALAELEGEGAERLNAKG